ncbi:MAG: ACT domain-containing protein [Chloroflexi bacterium]|nr:ACT domain-containing protein [Chloroflexota bacterium]
MNLEILPDTIAVCRLDAAAPIPTWARGDFVSITRMRDELSIVCAQLDAPRDVKCERDWRALRVSGALDFALVGILAALATPLADAGISIFAISTFDTDHLLVKQNDFDRAIAILVQAGHAVKK